MRKLALATAMLLVVAGGASAADKSYGPGVSDTEIVLGQTMPYSGPASAWGLQGRLEVAYFTMLNAKGGINGRKIKLSSLDDGYSPPKTVELTRQLIESDHVFADVGSIGTPTNLAVHRYLNQRKVPQILLAGGTAWNDPKNFPWSLAIYPPFDMEARIYGQYLLHEKPNAKVALLYQNDDYGKDLLRGVKAGLGAKAAGMIVGEQTYEVTDPTVDSQIVALQGTGADVLMVMASPKFAAQALRKSSDIGWKPQIVLAATASSIGAVLQPAGVEKAVGAITALAYKTPTDPAWKDDKEMQDYLAFLKKWDPDADPADTSDVNAYVIAEYVAMVLEKCGDDLTRENFLKQATNIHEVHLPMMLPGNTITITPDDYSPIHAMQLARFDGKSWVRFGDLIHEPETAKP